MPKNGEKLNPPKGAGFRVGQEHHFFVHFSRWRFFAFCFLNVVVWRFAETGRKGTCYNFWIFLKTISEGRQQVSRFSKGKRFFVAIFKLPLFRQKVFVLRLRKFIFREQALRFPLHYHFRPVPICVAGRRTRGGRGASGNRVIAAD